MQLSLFDYNLPKELIAQQLASPRDSARLMVINKKNKTWIHEYFFNLDKYLNENCVLVFNDSKVIPARIRLAGGGEIFLLNELGGGEWEVVGRKLGFKTYDFRSKNKLVLKCEIVRRLGNGNWVAKFSSSGKKFRELLEKIGETPLPPYIKIKDSKSVRNCYQTVFAKNEGSVAAPTAGLHFTKRLIKKLEKKGVKMEFVTLHVGLGTFKPVAVEKIEEHKIHSEMASIDQKTAERLNQYKRAGKEIIAVGTTACRTLEALSSAGGRVVARNKLVNIYIYPGYKFKFVDGLITNFHLPKSTLLMLVSAMAGRKLVLDSYAEAIKSGYRFYSFGEGMFIR